MNYGILLRLLVLKFFLFIWLILLVISFDNLAVCIFYLLVIIQICKRTIMGIQFDLLLYIVILSLQKLLLLEIVIVCTIFFVLFIDFLEVFGTLICDLGLLVERIMLVVRDFLPLIPIDD